MSDRNHYEVLGVEPDAERDAIREAYRSRVAELKPDAYRGSAEERVDESMRVNKAWNVLSDPYQRGRYDAELETHRDGAEAGDDATPADRGAVASPGALQGLFSGRRRPGGAGSPSGGAAGGAGRGGKDAPARAGDDPPGYPAGLSPAPTRSRVNALSIDLAILILIVFGIQFASKAVADPVLVVYRDGKPARTVQVKDRDPDALERQLEQAEDRRHDRAVREAEAKDEKAPKKPKVEVKHEKLPVGTAALLLTLASVILPLAYLVPMSALTGQTLGKRWSHLELVRVDGSPAGWAGSLVHYGVPIVVGMLLMPIGYLIGIGLVLWWLGDPRRQGVHDKLARTLVVEVPPGGLAGTGA